MRGDGRSMKNKKKIIPTTIACASIAVTAWIAFSGYQWSWGPFAKLHDIKTAGLPGNDDIYSPERIPAVEYSPLNGKHLVFLGSSVTYGSASMGISFADYISARNRCIITKKAVSGTTLVDEGSDSYITRLEKLDTKITMDMLVCQLSTNDATQRKPLGSISDSANLADFDTKTVAGAIEYIIAYVEATWGCPVVFYTNPRYDSIEYAAMVMLLKEIADKWNVTVIDMWNDNTFCAITTEQRDLYMADSIHPTRAGYLEWWTPYMEKYLYQAVDISM